MDDKRPDLNLLLAFDALLSEQNVTRAAKRLNLSQPALSAQLARLRDLFGDQLFIPTSRGVMPTAVAEELREPVRRTLEEAKSVFGGRGFDPATAAFTFTIAASDYMQVAVLLPFPTAISESRAKGEGDGETRHPAHGAGGPRARRPRPRFPADRNSGNPRRTRAARTRGELCRHRAARKRADRTDADEALCGCAPYHRRTGGESFLGPTDAALAAAGLTRTVSFAVSSFVTLIEAVAQSDLIAMAPERLARRYADRLDLFKAPVDVPGFGIAMVWHDRTKDHPAHRWLRDRLAAFCQATPRGRR